MNNKHQENLGIIHWYAANNIDFIINDKLPKRQELKSPPISPGIPEAQKNTIPMEKESKTAQKPNISDLAASPIDAARESRRLSNEANTLEQLRDAVFSFDGCSLKTLATNTVFSDGNPEAKILLVGEAPGASEDKQGIPFCGESGKLLDKIFASVGLCRSKNIYITNTIFWRPPGNRQPTNQELEICRPFVEKHIALIKPEIIILVGGTALTSLLGNQYKITKARREYLKYTNCYLDREIDVTAIFHPAYLLRQPMQKKSTWYDMLKIWQFIQEKNIKI